MIKGPTRDQLPTWHQMRDDLQCSLIDIARHLKTPILEVHSYEKNRAVPRAIQLALFYETRWGREHVSVDLANELTIYKAWVRCLREENEVLRSQVQVLELSSNNDAAANARFIENLLYRARTCTAVHLD